MFLLSAALLLGMQTIPEYAVVEVRERGKGCEYRAEGRRITQAQLEHRAKVWARQGRDGEVQSDRDISFNCVGTAIAIMQNAGMEKVAYVGKPIAPGVVLEIPAKGCTPVANGEPLTMEALRTQAVLWGRDKIEVQLLAELGANIDCVGSVQAILRDANAKTRIGLIGGVAPAR